MRGQQAARISKALLLQDQLVARKTKIVCTLGPSSWTEDGLAALLDAGMNVARFNFSHYAGGSHEAHQAVLDRLRKVAAARGCIVGCLLDTKGPEIRTAMLRGGKDIHLVAGQDIIVAAVGDRFREFEGYKDEQSGETKIGLSYAGLCAACKPGSHIVCSDGYVRIEVVRIISDTDLLGRVLTTHSLGQGVSCNLPGVKLVLPVLSASDIQDVQQFAARNQMDYIATSFVQSAADVRFVKQILHEAGGLQVKVIAKIENEAGLRDIDDIISVADGVMVARGDLAMEVPPERIALAQKLIIAKCNAAGKLVITATQMMESMVHHPMPTRAEMSDVANAVLDGTDAVMLSSESSLGLYPDATVRWMACIVEHAELGVDHEAMHARFDAASGTDAVPAVQRTLAQVMKQVLSRHNWGAGPAEKCRRCMIVVFSETGLAAELLAQCRPPCPVYVVSNSNAVLGGCTARHGLRPCRINTPLRDIRMASGDLVNHIRSLGVDLVGQAVIIVSGMACLCADQAPQMTVHHVAPCGRCSLDLGDQHWPTIFS